eukprot:gene9699-20160_t
MRIFVIIFTACSVFPLVNSIPKSINIGIIASRFTNQGKIYLDGTHQVAAIFLALAEINNKHDGIYDDLLPNTQLQFALRGPGQSFLGGLEAVQDFSNVVFGGKGVKAVIGGGYDEVSRATGQLLGLGKIKINQIDFGAFGSFLSHADLYPYYSRVNPVDAYAGRVLAKLIKSYYGLQNVNVFSTADTYGTDIALEFRDECTNQGINIENFYNFFPGTTEFSDLIKTVKNQGVLKVFVLLMKASDAGPLLEQGYNAGLFGEGTQIFGNRYMYTTAMFKYMSKSAPIGDIMKGVIGLDSPYMNKSNDGYRGFVRRFIAQNATKIVNLDGSVQCSDVMDDDGSSYLFKHPMANGLAVCTGLDYSTFATDGSDIASTAYLAYDAVLALTLALDELIYKQGKDNFTANELREAIRYNVSFQGASGHVEFKNIRPKSQGYGLGDRLNGLMYKIWNFNPATFHGGTSNAMDAFNTIGYFTPETYTFQTCDIWTDNTCSKPVFKTRDGLPVDNSANVVEVQMPQTIRTVLSVAAAIALAIVCWFTFIVVLYMDDRIIKSAQPNMLFMMLFGGLLGGIRIILATLDLTDTLCIVGKWVGHLAFVFVFGAMIVKTWRVDRVINSGFAKVKVTQADANRIFWGFIGCVCLYLMFDTIFGKPHRAYDESFDGHNMVRLIKCRNDEETFTSVLFALEGLLLAYGARLCWSTKEVAGAVNDSSYISLALFLILFVCAVTFPIELLSITPTPVILMTIMATGFFIAVCGCIIIMFAPKTSLIFSGAQVDENLKIVYADKRPPGSSSSSSTSHVINQLKNKIKNRTRDRYGASTTNNAQSVDQKPTYVDNHEIGGASMKKKWTSPLNIGIDGKDVKEVTMISGHGSDDYKMTDFAPSKCDDESTPEIELSTKSSTPRYDSKTHPHVAKVNHRHDSILEEKSDRDCARHEQTNKNTPVVLAFSSFTMTQE